MGDSVDRRARSGTRASTILLPPDRPARSSRSPCYVYSPAGVVANPEVNLGDPDAPGPETTPNAYTAGSPGATWLFVVATDQTGGMSAASVPLTIVEPPRELGVEVPSHQ